MTKRILLAIIAVAIAASAIAKPKKAEPVNPDSTGFIFTDIINIPVTHMGDQNRTGTCWCFSTNSFFENEILKKTGKTVNLSEMFVVNHCYRDKAMKYIRMDGEINFAQGGSALDVPYVWRTYGMVPEEVYSGLNYGDDNHNHSELAAVLTSYVGSVKKLPQKKLTSAWHRGLCSVIDAYLGELPTTFRHEGVTYTPQSYAASLGISMDDYVPLTSFTHHPFDTKFIMEVADNWVWGEYVNIPLADFKEVVDNALENGYSVAWAADVSEDGWQWKNGFAVLPREIKPEDMDSTEYARWSKISTKERNEDKKVIDGPVPEIEVTQQLRQEWFDNHETTDDHGMVIVGKARDQEGTLYYKVKNSWNTNQLYDGYIYVSEAYFLGKTIDICVNRDAIPSHILNRISHLLP